MLDDRKLSVLKAIVTDYVASREPVGSKGLVERHQLDVSSATVRNDMAVLEEEGYITQPHTSAGRIPTDKGYRLFVDRLADIKPLSAAERRAISSFMTGAIDTSDLVTRTVRLLAQLTRQVAIVQYPVAQRSVLRHVDFVPLSTERAMVIVVDSSGEIVQQVVDSSQLGEVEFDDLRVRIRQAVIGQALPDAALALSRIVDETDLASRGATVPLVSAVLELIGTNRVSHVMVAGIPNLAAFGPSFETSFRPLLEALEEQMVLLRLLGEASGGDDITVRIGRENTAEEFRSTSIVASPYGAGDELAATLGVVGPTRMDYPSTIASVRAVARYVSRFLTEG